MSATDPAAKLNQAFDALANDHRRAIIDALSLQPCSISRLAALRSLSLPAIHKHVKILENAGLVLRNKIGRTNYLALDVEGLRGVQAWLTQFQTHWGSNAATLENYFAYLEKDERGESE